jgi:hypothetical protein
MTGGDSFPYVEIVVPEKIKMLMPRLRVEGRYILKDVQLRVVDTVNDAKLQNYKGGITVNEMASARFKAVTFYPQVSPTTPQMLSDNAGIDANPLETTKSYDLEIVAINGAWKECLRARYINGTWEEAIRVFKADDKKPESDWVIVKDFYTQGFPPRPASGPLPQ